MNTPSYRLQKQLTQWLNTATGKIRYLPDRKKVREELFSHIMDREEAWLLRGKSVEEARRLALADMGRAQDIAEDLARLHRPWWGYARLATRVLLILSVVLLVIPTRVNLGFNAALLSGTEDTLTGRLTSIPDPPRNEKNAVGTSLDTVAEFDLSGTAELGGSRVTVPAAWAEKHSFSNQAASVETYELVLYIRVRGEYPWTTPRADSLMLTRGIITDSEGVRYSDRSVREKVEQVFSCEPHTGGLSHSWYEVRLELPSGQVPRQLHIPMGYGSYVLHIDFEKEEVS